MGEELARGLIWDTILGLCQPIVQKTHSTKPAQLTCSISPSPVSSRLPYSPLLPCPLFSSPLSPPFPSSSRPLLTCPSYSVYNFKPVHLPYSLPSAHFAPH